MNKELILPIVRHALQIICGVLVAKGVVTADESGQLVELSSTAIGSLIGLGALVWMIKDKKAAAKKGTNE